MVLMQQSYKTDRQLEEELKESDHDRMVIKRPCLPDSLYGYYLHKEEPQLNNPLTKKLLDEMKKQEMQITYLLKTVLSLQENQQGEQPKVVIVEEVSKEEGKTLVEDYFKVHGSADIEELMLNLKMPVRSIIDIIDELQKEGKLAPKGENDD